MKKTLLTFLLGVTSFTQLFSESSVWKITKNGNTVYLGGSIHLLRQTDYPLPNEFDIAYDNSEITVFEANASEMKKPEIAQKLISKCMYKGSTTLKDVLSPDTYNKLSAKSMELSIPIENIHKFNPSFATIILTAAKLQQLGVNAEGVDNHYLTKSINDDKQTFFLESIDEQMDLIANISNENEDKFVEYTLNDFEHIEKEFEVLIASWRNGTSAIMIKHINEMKKEFPNIYDSLILRRNENWTSKIEKYFQTKETEFVIVGALHMYGEQGLIKLLKNKGYKIEKVST